MRVRLNTIFYFILAADLVLYLVLFDGTSKYLDDSSITYYIIFSLCILITIIINGKRKNIFLEMLIGVIIIGYHFRIPILLYSDVSTTMSRISVSSGLINHKIIELCYHYLALSIAIIILNPKINKLSYYINKHTANKILLLASIVIFFDIAIYSVGGYAGMSSLMGHFSIIFSIFSRDVAMLVVITYIVAAGRTLLRIHKYWATVLIVTFVVYGYYLGSKAAIVLLILYFMIARLICYGPIIIKIRNIRNLIISIILIFLVGVGFFVGDIMRYYQRGLIGVDSVINRFWMIENSLVSIFHSVSSRLGYFDYYIEYSENSLYLPYISFKYYFTSIVDKLTPGFDLFGNVYASRMFYYAREGAFPEIMHSDQVTIFGEASVIFSFGSIMMFFIMILFFAFLIRKRPSRDPFMNIFYLAIIFHAYCRWLNGFGFDMFLCQNIVYPIIFFFCMRWFCRFTFHK